MKVGKEDTVLL